MEKMPYQEPAESLRPAAARVAATGGSWRHGLPACHGAMTVVRDLRTSDAPALLAAMSTEEVARFISPPPSTVQGFEKFIAWAQREREAGRYVCFAVTAKNSDTAIGLFQVRAIDAGFGTAEWGFAIATAYWGTGVFQDAARMVLQFSFGELQVHRLEARAAVRNGRGNGALRKLGAMQEGVLRRSFVRNGEYHDQALWTILAEEWRQAAVVWGPRVIHSSRTH